MFTVQKDYVYDQADLFFTLILSGSPPWSSLEQVKQHNIRTMAAELPAQDGLPRGLRQRSKGRQTCLINQWLMAISAMVYTNTIIQNVSSAAIPHMYIPEQKMDGLPMLCLGEAILIYQAHITTLTITNT
jgi:hypothetical protein